MSVLRDIAAELERQSAKWGEQNHPDGTGSEQQQLYAEVVREHTNECAKNGTLTWTHILDEECAEAFASTSEDELRTELIHSAAVAIAWVEAIDRRRRHTEPVALLPDRSPLLTGEPGA